MAGANGADPFSRYEATLTFDDLVLGGAPRNPGLIPGWLRSKAGITDEEEVAQMLARHLVEMGVDVGGGTFEEVVAASEAMADERNLSGFKRDGEGLYLESRQVKALLKEAVHVLYGGVEKWGPTRKGPKSYVAERVFVRPDHIHLGRSEPDRVEARVGHVTGPSGPRSMLALNEAVERATIAFEVLVLDDCVTPEQWSRIWALGEHLGLGATRSQGYGTFRLESWAPAATRPTRRRRKVSA